MKRWLPLAALLLAWGFSQPEARAAAPVTSPPRVLILDETVDGGINSQEAAAAVLAIPGCAVDVVSAVNWAGIPATGLGGPTGYGFDSYRAIILGDPICTGPTTNGMGTSTAGYLAALTVLNGTKTTWTPVVTGNVILEGVDNAFHSGSQVGADKTIKRGIGFAVNDPTRTGLYYALSCYYDYTAPATNATLVPHLTGFGSFMVRNYPNTCFNDTHIVATHPVFTAAPPLTDAELSNWSCSTHEGFDAWPPNFVVLAIALTNGAYTATDGSNGVPYILVRGEGVKVISSLELDPPVATNNVGTTHTVCATLSTNITPYANVPITFTISSGPNAVTNFTTLTDSNGMACFTYTGMGGPGVDYITASCTYFDHGKDVTISSGTVTKIWENTCVAIGCDSVECQADGTWTYSFCVTNLTGAPMLAVTLQNPPAGISFTPGSLSLVPLLNPGDSTNLTVSISSSGGPTNFCFLLGAVVEDPVIPPCAVPHCIALSGCCNRVITNQLTYASTVGSVSTYNYQITIQNVTGNPLKWVAFGADQSCVTFNPPMVDLTLPAYGGPSLLYPSQTRTFTVQVQKTAPCAGTNTFYLSTLTTNLTACCSTKLTLPKPRCVYLASPYDGSVVLTNTPILARAVAPPVSINPCPFGWGTVLFYRDTTLIGIRDVEPYEVTDTPTLPGVYSYTAVVMLSNGELQTSDPAEVNVIIPGESHGQDDHSGGTLSAGVTGDTLLLNIATEVGHHYTIEYKTNLVTGEWTTLTNVTGDGTTKVISDPVTNDTSRYYRSFLGP